MPTKKNCTAERNSKTQQEDKPESETPPASADPTSLETRCKIHQGTCQRNPICPQTNNRHDKRKKHEQEKRTGKENHPCKNRHRRILEYADWVSGKPFRQEQIQIEYNEHKRAQIKNYIYTEKKKTTRQKFGLEGTISIIQERWQTRKIQKEANRLQEAADQDNMQPIWDYRRQLRTNTKARDISIKGWTEPNAEE